MSIVGRIGVGWEIAALLIVLSCQPREQIASHAPPSMVRGKTGGATSSSPPPSASASAPRSAAPATNPAARWGKQPVAPSSGCKRPRAASAGASDQPVPAGAGDERVLVVAGAERKFIVSLPAAYDGSIAYPLVFGFHGRTRTHRECRDVDCRGLQALFAESAVIVYMKSLNAGWRDEGVQFTNNLPFFEATLSLLKTEYCVDESRVIVSGTSSGAMFANQLACEYSAQLMAVFPVGGAAERTTGCGRPIPAVVLHGIDDTHVTLDRGEATRDLYRQRNGCTQTTRPSLADARAAVRADRTAGLETYRCVDYQGCKDGLPVRWCEHGEGGWDNSTHAWPTFGGQILADFLNAL